MSIEYKIIASARVDPRKVTGKTVHRIGAQTLRPPTSLLIVQIPPQPQFYLLYLDEQGDEMTDTFHETFEGAQDQALFEFQLEPEEWEMLPTIREL